VLVEIAVDGGLQVDDGSEVAAPEALAGEIGEEAFNGVEPGTGFRGEVEGPARVPGEPGVDLGVGVRGVGCRQWHGPACRLGPHARRY